MSNLESFKSDLKELIKKHNVSLDGFDSYDGQENYCGTEHYFVVNGVCDMALSVADTFTALRSEIIQESKTPKKL